ncbi:MAG TPA: patatin-like phospholipase family protein [Smithella sp.]|nr:patatin-like phospholipase family protein [Smithella sp.]HNY50105.1 patatin-like phospholipase family protein [Smithella sp.]HOG90205.1 patatin-like phospholipase family protein [Smithella sp.]HOU52027.1 patatin-like phospholipase family protein [Smithella sp.]HQG65641.1 patatin-like phospholipase family protein [Smithella sp.]
MMKWTGKKVGIALGGGGVRGFSHIGVLKVLEEEGIGIDLIVGTSAGALIGGAYASGQSPKDIQAKIDTYLQSPEFDDSKIKSVGLTFTAEENGFFKKARTFVMNRLLFVQAFFKPSILPSHDFQSLINFFLPDIDIQKTRIPFHVVTTDLITGKKIVFSEGSLRTAVLASCAVPGAVTPVRHGEWLLADGGITSLVPVHAARDAGADMVIAVIVDRDLQTNVSIETAKDVVFRAGEITTNALEESELSGADVVIRPAVGALHWMDFRRAIDLVKAGEDAARESLAKINAELPFYRRMTRFAARLFKK